MKKHIIIVPKIILTPENKVTEDMMGGGEEEFNEYLDSLKHVSIM